MIIHQVNTLMVREYHPLHITGISVLDKSMPWLQHLIEPRPLVSLASVVGPGLQVDGRSDQGGMAKLLLDAGNVHPRVQGPAAEAVPQDVRGDPLPHFAGPRLQQLRSLCGLVQQPLDQPGGDMPLNSVREDVSTLPALS